MSDGTLPPIVASLTGDASELLATFGTADDAVNEFANTAEEASARSAAAFDEMSAMAAKSAAAARDAMAAGATDEEVAAAGAGTAFSRQVDDAEEAATRTETAAESVVGSMGRQATSAEEMADRTAKADKAASDAHSAVADAADRASSKIGGVFSSLGGLLAGLPFAESLKKLGDDLDHVGESAASYGAVLADVGKLAVGVGAAGLAAFSVEAVKAASTFDAAMEQLHTQAGVPQAQIASLEAGVEALAGKVGEDPDSLADALFHIESNFQSVGITGKQALSDLQIAAEGAKVGQANLTDVTNALSAALVANISGVQNTSEAMGALNAIVGSGDMHMQDLADAFGTGVVASAKAAGLSLNDVGAALATLGDNNIRGAKAGTDLRMAFQALEAPLLQGQANLQGMGFASGNLDKQLQQGGLKLALNDLSVAMQKAGISSKETEAFLTQTFGKRAGVGITVLMTELDRFNSKYADIAGQAKTFGDAWNSTQQTTKQQLDQVGDSLKALAIEYGNWLTPKLKEALHVVEEVVVWFTKHREVTIALASVIGGVLVTAVAAYAVSMGIAAVETLAALWPIELILVAAGALAVGIYELVTHWHQVTTAVKQFIETHKYLLALLIPFGPMIMAIVGPIVAVYEVVTHWGQITQWFAGIWHTVWATVGPIVHDAVAWVQAELTSFEAWWNAHWSEIKEVLSDVWDVMRDNLKVTWALISGIISAGMTIITNGWRIGWAIVSTTLVTTWDVIKGVVSIAIDVIKTVIGVGLDLITGHWSKAWTDLKNGVASIFHDLINMLESLVTDFFNGAVKLGEAIVHGIISGLSNLGSDVLNTVKSAVSSIPGGSTVMNVLGLAEGGIVTKPTLAMVGEAGYPEAVIPLKNGINADASAVQPLPTGGSSGGAPAPAGQPIQVNITTTLDGKVVARNTTFWQNRDAKNSVQTFRTRMAG